MYATAPMQIPLGNRGLTAHMQGTNRGAPSRPALVAKDETMTTVQTILVVLGLLGVLVALGASLYGIENDRRSADAFYRRLNAQKDARRAARRNGGR